MTARIDSFTVEQRASALGIGAERPRLSWTVDAPGIPWRQAGYELELTRDGAPPETLVVEGGDSVLVPWPFAALGSRGRARVRVRVREIGGRVTAWSEPVAIETGLLRSGEWTARFVAPAVAPDGTGPCPLLRREFEVRGPVRRARLYATALGVYELELNGATVGDEVLAPGWTSYDHRLRYQTHDVTDLLQPGGNVLGATLADGWYRGRLGWDGGHSNVWGDRLALLAQLEIDYEDGGTGRVVTDESWHAAPGPTLAASLYDGEEHDARLEPEGWSRAGFDDTAWDGVALVERDLATLVAPTGPPVRRIELVSPKHIETSRPGRTIVDFGQNLVGRVRLTVQAPAGQAIRIRHAEVLDDDGELCTRPLRDARATDTYICRGSGLPETWEPRFTFHGFRYAEIAGRPEDVRGADLAAVVCHSDLRRTGWFESSDALLNRLHANVVWGMRGNFLDVPTDCPQRDERMGWTGDLQVFAPTACFLYDLGGLLTSWLADLAADQHDDGGVPLVVPDALSVTMPEIDEPRAAWSDAAVIVPSVLYQRYGDRGILEAQFDSMCRWIEHVVAGSDDDVPLWGPRFQYGDWLDPTAPADEPWAGGTPAQLVADAYFARCTQLLAQIAAILGRGREQERYAALAGEIRTAFAARYLSAGGRVLDGAETAHALILAFDLLGDAGARAAVGDRLAALVEASGHRIACGFIGTAVILDALCATGHEETAYRLVLQRECPSWLYPVTMGATTMWERWDGVSSDGSLHPGGMVSYNHYALGAVGDWLHRTVAGLGPDAQGYRRLRVRPRPGGGLTWAKARHITPYGPAEVRWSRGDGSMLVEALVPANAEAVVDLPLSGREPFDVGPGRHRWAYAMTPTPTPAVG